MATKTFVVPWTFDGSLQLQQGVFHTLIEFCSFLIFEKSFNSGIVRSCNLLGMLVNRWKIFFNFSRQNRLCSINELLRVRPSVFSSMSVKSLCETSGNCKTVTNNVNVSKRIVVTHVVSQPRIEIFRMLHITEGRRDEDLRYFSQTTEEHNDTVRPVEQHGIFWILFMDCLLHVGYDLSPLLFVFILHPFLSHKISPCRNNRGDSTSCDEVPNCDTSEAERFISQ